MRFFWDTIFTAISQKNILSTFVMPCHDWKTKKTYEIQSTFLWLDFKAWLVSGFQGGEGGSEVKILQSDFPPDESR